MSSFIHTLYIDKGQKYYESTSANASYYPNAYLHNAFTSDSSSLLQVRNVFGLALQEGFHSWAKFGLTAFIEHDFRRYMTMSGDTSALGLTRPSLIYHNKNLIWVGGELIRKTGTLLNFNASGKICMVGEDLGDFELKGHLQTSFKIGNQPVTLKAEGLINNAHPDYFYQKFASNHFKWDNNFSNELHTALRGSLIIPQIGIETQLGIDNLTNLIYFNTFALPTQFTGNLQIITLKVSDHLRTGILNFNNQLVGQFTSNKNVMPLPNWSLYSNLYLKFLLSKVLTSYIGVDCKYHTAYFAPAYMPATSQFYNQNVLEVGNYPFVNAYGNFHLKRMRFFVMYSHLSRYFAQPNYFSAPHYPINPAILKVGLSWNFYD